MGRSFVRKAQDVLSSWNMFSAYSRWVTAWNPGIKIGAAHLRGFTNFSEYYGTLCNMPSPAEQRFVKRCREANLDCPVMDVGANIGQFAVIMAAAGRAPVHCFEPVPSTFVRLKSNVRSLNVILNCVAISDRTTLINMHVDETSPATNHVLLGPTEAASVGVGAVSLDTYFETNKIHFSPLVKVDVEGAELLVIRGAGELLRARRIGALLIEVCPANLTRMGFDVGQLVGAVEDRKYTFRLLNTDGTVGSRVSEKAIGEMTLTNLVIVPD